MNVGEHPSSRRRDADEGQEVEGGFDDGLRFFEPVGVGVQAMAAAVADRASAWQGTPCVTPTPTEDGINGAIAIADEAAARPAIGVAAAGVAEAAAAAAVPQPSANNETGTPSSPRPAPSAGSGDAARSQPLPYRATRRTTRVAGLSPPPSPSPPSILPLAVGRVAEPPRATGKRACLGVAGARAAVGAASPAAADAVAAAVAAAADGEASGARAVPA